MSAAGIVDHVWVIRQIFERYIGVCEGRTLCPRTLALTGGNINFRTRKITILKRIGIK